MVCRLMNQESVAQRFQKSSKMTPAPNFHWANPKRDSSNDLTWVQPNEKRDSLCRSGYSSWLQYSANVDKEKKTNII